MARTGSGFRLSHPVVSLMPSLRSPLVCSMQTREAEYPEEVKRWERSGLEIFAEAFAGLDGSIHGLDT
jgi:hypothetical protein